MFIENIKRGDILVCVDDYQGKGKITIGKRYKIGYASYVNDNVYEVSVINDSGLEGFYHISKFVTEETYRNQVIDGLLL